MKSLFSFLLLLAVSLFSLGLHAQEEVPTETDSIAQPPMEEQDDAYASTERTIGQAVGQNAQTTTLASALDAAGMTADLDADGSYILLAPTDDAFAALPEGLVDALLLPENSEALTTLLSYHFIDSADTDASGTMTRVLEDGQVTVGENLPASNGVVYLIDQVLIPEGFDVESLLGE
ncbi:fasciclin domain-containing protein [Neolewinella sp.]|uniref:fasciclin domain-containing protein n=1 Tax=Neolewinella sp. TaxID=2993543 RepID=UPI003B51B572